MWKPWSGRHETPTTGAGSSRTLGGGGGPLPTTGFHNWFLNSELRVDGPSTDMCSRESEWASGTPPEVGLVTRFAIPGIRCVFSAVARREKCLKVRESDRRVLWAGVPHLCASSTDRPTASVISTMVLEARAIENTSSLLLGDTSLEHRSRRVCWKFPTRIGNPTSVKQRQ